jgi:predicted dehydrogenase
MIRLPSSVPGSSAPFTSPTRVDFRLVYDTDAARAEAAAAAHGARAAEGPGEVFDPARIDAVLIASSAETYAGTCNGPPTP